ncbi:GntR family transcriptional regulator [Streptomyces sp. NPDC101160]|uniref:GntR family transcriptional regulator n=1 Tax=Streptomyces sp. NPDC101160 TaxID=3366118 RepID=UPI00381A82FE
MKPDRDLSSGSRVLASVGRVRTRQRASDRVYEELASAVSDLRILPGASLSETDLADQLHVSRTPLREAIARLVETGLVSVVPQVGTRVELIRLYDVEQARFVRESLETAAFAVACANPARDVAPLRYLLAEQERCHERGDVDGFFAADEALHEQVFAISGYLGAWQVMQPMKMHLDRLRRLSLPQPDTIRALIDEHTAIVDALEAGDAVGGRERLVRHARRALEDAPALQAQYPEYFAD